MKTGHKVLIAGLSVLSILLFAGWVLPAVPYLRRISKEQAQALVTEYGTLYTKMLAQRSGSAPTLTADETARMMNIKQQLMSAGYGLKISGGTAGSKPLVGLDVPEYAMK